MDWTPKQTEVLEAIDQDVLVAAAAGSGKTAVMVEKVLRLVKERRTDIDNILAVTFTKAAAAEMKERLTKKLGEILEENPDDEYIYKQICYVQNSKITTIDSFCAWVVKRYYNLTDLDPMFRVADETESKLLLSDSFAELIRDIVDNPGDVNEDDLYNVLNYYTSAKKSDELEKVVIKLLGYSKAYVEPDKWFDECVNSYKYDSFEEFKDSRLVKDILKITKDLLRIEYEKMLKGMEVIESESLLNERYGDIYKGYLNSVETMVNSDSFEEVYEIIKTLKFKDGKRAPKGTEEAWSVVKSIRDNAYDVIEMIRDNYFEQPLSDYYDDICKASKDASIIIYLCKELDKRYSEYKRRNNIADFDDISHRALDILVKYNEETGEYEKTDVAIDISNEFKYTFIDEYQDSNEVQETILNAVSHRNGKPNRFMVGDVKQSIYGFRNSNPKIFMQKYESYSDDKDAKERRIFLDQNFRSRVEVLDFVNYFFKQVMVKDIGDVTYDEKNYLVHGADFPASFTDGANATEVILISDEEDSDTRIVAEATVVAQRILNLINPEHPYKVYDRGLGDYRNARLSDIAILCRTAKYDNKLMNVLAEFGIESYSQKSTGYFTSEEITLLLSVLDIIDNPYNDVKLLTVMKSKLYDFTDLDLSLMKINANKRNFYNNLLAYIDKGEDDNLKKKTEYFVNQIDFFREQTNYMGIYELIDLILDKTGFMYLVKSMPAGRVRVKNIEMLKEMALTFEQSSYKGLFNFIRYINKQKDYEIDVSGSLDVNENDDAVRIMTIHKSKGLQFPIVFLFATGKEYNTGDEKENVVLDRQLGIGLTFNDKKLRIKADTLNKKRIKKKLNSDMKGEELRLLYVALTRAEEKLIITGNLRKADKIDDVFSNGSDNTFQCMPTSLIEGAKSYLEIIGLALSRHRCLLGKIEGYEFKTTNDMYMQSREVDASFDCVIYDTDEEGNLVTHVTEGLMERLDAPDRSNKESSEEVVTFRNLDSLDVSGFEEKVKKIKDNFSYVYPFAYQTKRRTKVSISEIKRAYYEELKKESEDELVFTEKLYPVKPKFISNEEEKSGARIGTMYHRIFELFDYNIDFDEELLKSGDYSQIKNMIDSFADKGLINGDEYEEIPLTVYARFILSPMYEKLRDAYMNKTLRREQKFIFTTKASSISKEYKDDDPILIQGIIDAFYEKDGKVTIIDYKSDNVVNMKELKKKYEVQLQIYKRAVAQILQNDNVESFIYSTYLGESIEI